MATNTETEDEIEFEEHVLNAAGIETAMSPKQRAYWTQIVEAHIEWVNEEFPDAPQEDAYQGIIEEFGELTHSVLKQRQGIREDEDGVGRAADMDAIGDMAFYAIHWASINDVDVSEFDIYLNNPDREVAVGELYDELLRRASELTPRSGDPLNIGPHAKINIFIANLADLADVLGYDFFDCVEVAAGEVHERAWESVYKEDD